jgi:hydroxymethylpyrimidine/phosphomethylpyrimidine kinase
VYGFAITTANTIQTENQFLSIQWTDIAFVLRSIELFKKLSHKSSENWYCSLISIFARNSVSTKRLSPKTSILGHRSKIKYQYDFLNIEKNRFGKILKKSI